MRSQSICLALAIVLVCPFASAQWVLMNQPADYAFCFAVSGKKILVGTHGSGLSLSTNEGITWTTANNGYPKGPYDSLQYDTPLAFAVSGTNIFVGTYDFGVYRSTDDGGSWTQVGFRNTFIRALAVSGTNLFAGTDAGVFLSTDNGITWNGASNGLDRGVLGLAVSGSTIFAVTQNLGSNVFSSADNGSSWSPVAPPVAMNPSYRITSLFSSGTNLFAGAIHYTSLISWEGAGILLSTNSGASWAPIDSGLPSPLVVNAFAASGTNIFAGTDRGVFLSTNSGANWTAVNIGLADTVVHALAVTETNLFAATQKVWRRPLLEMNPASVNNSSETQSPNFSLEQNYPNPFNPLTNIKYTVGGAWSQGPEASKIRLVVYDLLGREVAVLVNEKRAQGHYEAKFDGSKLTSGVYFYRLEAADFVQTKRLVLLK